MADYAQGRSNGQNSGGGQGDSRGQAYSNIFGAPPPPGRSQTMTSSGPTSPLLNGHQGRTQTMSSGGPRQAPPRPAQGGGYQSPTGDILNGYGSPPQQQYRPPPRPGQVPSNPQPQFQYLPPQQGRQNSRPYPAPQRIDPRAPPSQGQRAPGPRYYGPPGAQNGPALNSDPYRSQSMASTQRPNMQLPNPAVYSQAPANAFRQAQYQGHPQASQTTAQGRPIPERNSDERTMSMSSYSHTREQQIMSGRPIPNRRPGGTGSQDLQNGSRSPAMQTRAVTMSSTSPTAVDMNRSMSMASTIAPTDMSLSHRPSVAKSISSVTGTGRPRLPLVNPALLSKVAECFREKILLGDRSKNDLTYKNAFSGAEAVDMITYIIKTTDRNLALLLGRALDAQKFFHDVTYDHRLRDSSIEMYQFKETMMEEGPETPEVNGVFVLLSECYSPTCTRDQLCYSIACPRRLEQQSRLNLAPRGGLQKQKSLESVKDEKDEETDAQKLWINTVSKEISDNVSEREQKRQEVISELMYTERDFVKDLEYLRDFWITPLRAARNSANPSPIPDSRKEKIVRTVFSNLIDSPSIHGVSSRFAESLNERQKRSPVVHNVGDIFLQFVPQFEPFVIYGSNQLSGKYEYENEKKLNPFFLKFSEEVERRKESRKLELNGYLTKPTTRLARYPLLLEQIHKYSEPGNPDCDDLPKAMAMIRGLLSRVNEESGKAENKHNLKILHEQLLFGPRDRVNLKLTDENRELIYKGDMKKTPTDTSSLTVYLFDHAVLLVKNKLVNKKENMTVYRRPIPLELLDIREMDEVIPKLGVLKRPSSSVIPGVKNNTADSVKKDMWPITFKHLGKGGYDLTLYASTVGVRKKWLEMISAQQEKLRQQNGEFYNKTILSSNFFSSVNAVNCVAPYDGGRKLIIGTDSGVFVSDRKAKDENARPIRVLDAPNVTQIDVLEEYSLLLVLSARTLTSYHLSALSPTEPMAGKKPKKIQNHCNFFKTGVCLGRHLVCCVKSTSLSTTIKVFEPNDAMSKGKKQKGFSKMFNNGQDELKAFKEFYIPTESTSIHFLKSKLCVACAKGFEVVSLETLETQSLLDQADTSLDFVSRKDGVRPIHIERLNGEFLLNYSEFSFFVNRNGWRARPEWKIEWEGLPQNFALSYPWILAFEPNFIEIRSIDTNIVHIIPHNNIRMLHTSTREIIFAYEDDDGKDVVAAIDFWPPGQKPESFASKSESSVSLASVQSRIAAATAGNPLRH